jgi:hypothetical protein
MFNIRLQLKKRRLQKKKLQAEKLNELIQNYFQDTSDKEILEVLGFIEENGVQMIPYEYMKQFPLLDFQVYHDRHYRLPYTIINSQRVYFPPRYSEKRIEKQIRWALTEQHDLSPHKYLTNGFNICDGATAALVGASNGIFGLSIIDKVKKLYLFEADKKWGKPLRLTFEPWGNKVEVVAKMVTDKDRSREITLDSYFSDRNEEVDYIQADVEGGEKRLLLGARKILGQNNNIKLSICCYHNQEDQLDFTQFLEGFGFKTHCSRGYLLITGMQNIKEPYLRRGILYAQKNLRENG